MSCQLCGGFGYCACAQQGLNNQTLNAQSQLGAQNLYGPIISGQQQSAINQAMMLQGQAYSQMGSGNIDAELRGFLTIIENKSDEEIAKSYVEEEGKQLIRFKEQLEARRTKFLEQCAKYRPSITPLLLERFAKLKAFI